MQIRAIRCLCYALVLALVSTLMPAPFTERACAQLMPTYSVGVIDFINESGVQGDMLARTATDAVAVEMAKSNRYDVSITRTMMKTKMDDLGLHSPLSKLDLVRLGEVLSADAMLQGSIRSVQLAGNGPTRRASVTIVCQMVDQASGEIINGAVQSGTSSARVGYTADDTSLINEAVNSAAYLTVRTMIDYVIPEATVMMNIGGSQVMINKGVRAGIKPGMRMIVLRDKEIIGYLDVTSTSPDDSYASVVKSMRGIQPEDKARAIFEMPTVSTALKSEPLPSGAPKNGHMGGGAGSKIAKFLIGAAIVIGLASIFRGGSGVQGPPATGTPQPLVLTWDPTTYNHGQNVWELQVIRDAQPVPVAAIAGHAQNVGGVWDLGRIDLSGLYGTTAPTGISYFTLSSGGQPTQLTGTIPAEGYGVTHSYMLRVLYRDANVTTTPPTYTYHMTSFSNTITATAVEPINADHILTPPNGDPLLVSQLRTGDMNLTWTSGVGATQYRVIVEPVVPGTGPTWVSSIIFAGSGTLVSLSDTDRLSLASALSSPLFVDKQMKWHVEDRHIGDTLPGQPWTIPNQDQWPIFIIGGTPGGPPG
jgi:hypothetical protein